MDALLTAILQTAPSWGVGGLLITYIVILIRERASVEERHVASLDQQDKLHSAELERVNRDHDAEISELTQKIRDLRTDVNALDAELSHRRSERLELRPRSVAPYRLGDVGDVDE